MRHINIQAIIVFIVMSSKLNQQIIFSFNRLTYGIQTAVTRYAHLALKVQVQLERIFVRQHADCGFYITSQYNVLIKRLKKRIIKRIIKLIAARQKRT